MQEPPRQPTPPHSAVACTPQRLPVAARSLRILVVDDMPILQQFLARILQMRGHCTVVAGDGAAAVEHCSREAFDLILMDVQMPGMDGLQATREIRALSPGGAARIPIVALSAHAAGGDMEQCLAAGMDGYIAKPIEASTLLEAVERFAAGNAAEGAIASVDSPIPGPPDASVAPGVPAVYDVREALATLGGSVELLDAMIAFFHEHASPSLRELQTALQSHQPSAASVAHRLKGTLLHLGASASMQAAAEVEQQAQRGEWTPAYAAYCRLVYEISRLDTALGAPS